MLFPQGFTGALGVPLGKKRQKKKNEAKHFIKCSYSEGQGEWIGI